MYFSIIGDDDTRWCGDAWECNDCVDWYDVPAEFSTDVNEDPIT